MGEGMGIFSVEILEELEKLEPQVRSAFIKVLKLIEKSIGEVVKRDDFVELKKVVADLAEAQRKSEERITRLEEAVRELIDAQKSSEERLTRLEKTVQELIEAQKKSEERITRLEKTVQELIEAQKKSEERITRLEKTVQELAEAQKKTEERLEQLIGEHKKTREQLGGLSHTVGYLLEDRAYRSLPRLLKEDFGIEVIGQLKRDYVEITPGTYEEVNILGKGKKEGKEIYIIGEAKTQLKKKDVDAFIKKVKKLEKGLYGEKFLLLVTYQASPKVRKYLESKGIPVYYSYQFEL